MKTLKSLLVLALLPVFCFGQGSGTIKGRVLDENGDPLPNAGVYVSFGDQKIGGATDLDGYYTIKPLNSGIYNLCVSSMGMVDYVEKGIQVTADKIIFIKDIKMKDARFTTGEVEIVEYREKLIDVDDPGGIKVQPSLLDKMPASNNLPNIIRTVSADVKVSDDGKEIYFRGSRNGTSAMYIDGVKSDNMSGKISGMAIGSFTVYSGGIPAKYGDVTGGIVVVETKGYFDYLNERKYKD